jgi:hypothetical protein
MAKGKGPWQEGRRAWERLDGWHQDSPSAHPGHPDDGQRAVEALADVGTVRHLLDQAELVAVRTARRHGKSWAEIAMKLGVTRQSAWERWRDLDDVDHPQPTYTAAEPMVVPNVIGLCWDDAQQALGKAGLVGVASDSDDTPLLAALGWPGAVVTDQSPESAAKVPARSRVTLWMQPVGGSAGVREPRRPKPSPKSAYELRPEPSDEAVG